MKYFLYTFAFFCQSISVFAKDAPVKLAWFRSNECLRLEIQREKTGTKHPTHQLEIKDAEVIKRMMSRISEINPNGDMMKSMLIDETITLKFECKKEKSVIEIYDGRIKTRSTGFNSAQKDRDNEKIIYQDINSVLFPVFAEEVLKIKDLTLDFGEFKITFNGVENFDHAPVTVSGQEELFTVVAKDGTKQKLTVSSGQLPPQPLNFKVGQQIYTLNTFQTKSKKNIHPFYFQILK